MNEAMETPVTAQQTSGRYKSLFVGFIVFTTVLAAVLAALHALPCARDAAIIGYVREQPPRVVLRTPLGGERVIEELEDDPLPRIC